MPISTKDRMRILFTRFPLASAHGGAENQTMWLATGLQGKGHHVSFLGSCHILLTTFSSLVAPTFAKATVGRQSSKLLIGPPPVSKWHAITFLWRRRSMQRQLIDALEALPERPDAICMLSLSEKVLLTEYAHKKGMKVLWIEHDPIGPWLTKNPWLPALKKVSAKATIVCVSELSRRMYINMGFDPSHVVTITNGVPADAQTSNLKPHSSSLRLGCVARLSPEKGIDVLCQALASIPDVTLSIVGKGEEEKHLQSLADQDAIKQGKKRITILPRMTDIDALYQKIDLLVLPSRSHDPFGLVAAEAMMRGIPVIVTDACGIASSLTDGIDACVVPAAEREALRDAVLRMKDRVFRHHIARHGQETARSLFSIHHMVEAYEALLTAAPSTAVPRKTR